MEAMKDTWTKGLKGMTGAQLKSALDYCADGREPMVPDLPKFRLICNQFKPQDVHVAIQRKFSAEELAANRLKVSQAVSDLKPKKDYRAWAKIILDNPKQFPDIAYTFAKQAMGAQVEQES